MSSLSSNSPLRSRLYTLRKIQPCEWKSAELRVLDVFVELRRTDAFQEIRVAPKSTRRTSFRIPAPAHRAAPAHSDCAASQDTSSPRRLRCPTTSCRSRRRPCSSPDAHGRPCSSTTGCPSGTYAAADARSAPRSPVGSMLMLSPALPNFAMPPPSAADRGRSHRAHGIPNNPLRDSLRAVHSFPETTATDRAAASSAARETPGSVLSSVPSPRSLSFVSGLPGRSSRSGTPISERRAAAALERPQYISRLRVLPALQRIEIRQHALQYLVSSGVGGGKLRSRAGSPLMSYASPKCGFFSGYAPLL